MIAPEAPEPARLHLWRRLNLRGRRLNLRTLTPETAGAEVETQRASLRRGAVLRAGEHVLVQRGGPGAGTRG